jgi:hypothetical protein
MSLMKAFIIIELEIGVTLKKELLWLGDWLSHQQQKQDLGIGRSNITRTIIIHPWTIKTQGSLKKIIDIAT